LGLGAEGGLAAVDGLTAPDACEDLGVSVAHTWSTAAQHECAGHAVSLSVLLSGSTRIVSGVLVRRAESAQSLRAISVSRATLAGSWISG
jgi:hypothetical protein